MRLACTKSASESAAWHANVYAMPKPHRRSVIRLAALASLSLALSSAGGWALANEDAPTRPASLQERASGLVIAALNFLGVPYQRGGDDSNSGFDCSGFTRHVFQLSLGLVLPRRVDDQASARGLVAVDRTELRPGDLVFFNTLKRSFSHVGIYVGEGRFIHAPRSGSEVRIENLRQAYWAERYTGARRAAAVLDVAVAAPT